MPNPASPLFRSPVRTAFAALGLCLVGLVAYQAVVLVRAERHAWEARRALERFDFDGAREHLRHALAARPHRAEFHFLAARAARRAGDLEDAEAHLAECERLGGSSESALRLERFLLRARGGELSSVEGNLLRWVSERHPDTDLILEVLARAYADAGKIPEAAYHVGELLRRDPDHVSGLLLRGRLKERVNRFDEALRDYERAVELQPQDTWARLSLGELLLHFKRPTDAAEHFEYLERRLPGNAAVRLGVARCRRGLGRTDEAVRTLDALLAEHPREPLVLTERGQLALELGSPDGAEPLLRRAVELAPYDPRANYSLYQCLQQLGREQEAAKFLDQMRRGEADQKRYVELVQEVLKAEQAPAQRCELGVICLRTGREEEGVNWLLSSLREGPHRPEAHRALADYYDRAARPDLAARHRRLAANAPPSGQPGPP